MMKGDGETSDIRVEIVDLPWPDRCPAAWAREWPKREDAEGLWQPPCAQCEWADKCFSPTGRNGERLHYVDKGTRHDIF